MLHELLKHDNLGNERELGFVLFQALIPNRKHRLLDVTYFCTSNMFSISRSIKGIFKLLDFLSIINIDNQTVTLNLEIFNPKSFKSQAEYFNESHFFDCLLNRLYATDSVKDLFNENNLKLSHEQNQYYVKSHLIKLGFFPIRNLLLALNFLEQDLTVNDHLLINSRFTNFFREAIINQFEISKESPGVTLEQFKKSLEQKNEAGTTAELFVLNYEQYRLNAHPSFNQIRRISETNVNAGYDIKSFNDMDSFMIDRFIEVKSYKDEIAFYWSRNEVNMAKKLKTKYYLYLVDRSLINQPGYVPKIFSDPYKKIFENELWKKEIENWKITIGD